uniref:Pleiotropic regulator 1 n=1 Tax=Oryzias sinensis TaxID=183150 RepID=A0A8C8DJJ9_9TELE
LLQDVQKHSVHTLVFRSLKRTHDMFVADHAKAVALDDESHKLKLAVKLKADYSPVLHMPVLKEGKDRMSQYPDGLHDNEAYMQPDDPEYLITGTHAYPSGPGVALTADTKVHRNPSESGIHSLALALPPSQARQESSRTAATVAEIRRGAERAHAQSTLLLEGGGTRNSNLLRRTPVMPKPQWHPPWKLFRVISGHLGWVRSIAVEPGNQWFVTGSADRTIKIWDLASGKLKLSLTGHISTVRGVAVSSRSPYLFSCGEDKQVKCWDLEYNKVIRHYHGHLSAVYDLDLHPTIDVLMTCSRDATARVWDIRTKANVHTLTGHTNTVATVRCQAAEPQVITGSHDSTIRLWDLIAGKTRATLTNHKKSVRTLVMHPRHELLADNGTIHMWDWRTGYNFQRIHAAVQPGSLDSESGIFACVFDHSESRLITAEADKTIKVYKEDETATEESHPVNWKPEILKRKRY